MSKSQMIRQVMGLCSQLLALHPTGVMEQAVDRLRLEVCYEQDCVCSKLKAFGVLEGATMEQMRLCPTLIVCGQCSDHVYMQGQA